MSGFKFKIQIQSNPISDIFFAVFDFIACRPMFYILDDRILIFSGGNYGYFCDHTKNQVFILSLRGSKNPLSSPNKVTTSRHLHHHVTLSTTLRHSEFIDSLFIEL